MRAAATTSVSRCCHACDKSALLIQVYSHTALWCSIEYNMSYVYHAMSAYFDRDNVALPGLASYFRAAALEERGHAQQLMDFQVAAASSLDVHVLGIFGVAFFVLHGFQSIVQGSTGPAALGAPQAVVARVANVHAFQHIHTHVWLAMYLRQHHKCH